MTLAFGKINGYFPDCVFKERSQKLKEGGKPKKVFLYPIHRGLPYGVKNEFY